LTFLSESFFSSVTCSGDEECDGMPELLPEPFFEYFIILQSQCSEPRHCYISPFHQFK